MTYYKVPAKLDQKKSVSCEKWKALRERLFLNWRRIVDGNGMPKD